MRRISLIAVTSVVTLGLSAAPALARHQRAHHHHRGQGRHARIVHKRFGRDNEQPNPTPTNPTPTPSPSAGTVASFTNGVLTIALNGGTTTVSGLVTDATQLECSAPDSSDNIQTDDQGPGGGGDNNTTGQNGGSDDNGDNNAGQGDDNGDQGGGDNGDNQATCTTAMLTPGAVVQEADLNVSSNGAVWSTVDLVTP